LKPRFTFISHGVGWKRGAILRRLAKRKEEEKARKNAILRNAERRALGFAGTASAIDAAEVVKGAASPPAPETWRAAVREAVYATRESGGKSSSAARD
jgi:hypothetical protein